MKTKIDFYTSLGALIVSQNPTAPADWKDAAKKILRDAPLRPWMIRLLATLGETI